MTTPITTNSAQIDKLSVSDFRQLRSASTVVCSIEPLRGNYPDQFQFLETHIVIAVSTKPS